MAQRTQVIQRQEFYKQHLAGKTYTEIASQYGVSVKCVSNWCRRQSRGDSPQTTYFRPPSGLLSSFDPKVRFGVLRLRLEHPRWGSVQIAYHLSKRPSLRGLSLPHPAQIGRYLHQWARFRRSIRPRKKRTVPELPSEVHQCWQFDFKIGIILENGMMVNLHTVRDPFGEACLQAVIFPAGHVGQAAKGNHLPEARATLRRCFAHWKTLPQWVQTDGESTISAQRRWNDFPTLFTLWLVGLGIQHHIIRAGRPTDNAEVERCHRTITDYAIVGNEKCALDQLQDKLVQAVDELIFDLPSRAEGCQGKTPIQAHPELLQPCRTFQPEQEWAQFDLDRVFAYLGQLKWVRKSSKNGQIFLGDQRYYLGKSFAYREISIRFDPLEQKLIFLDLQRPEPEQEIRRLPIKGLSTEELLGFRNPNCVLVPQQLPLPLSGAVV